MVRIGKKLPSLKRRKKKDMAVKKIELEMYFDDDFVPPEKFDEATEEKKWDSKCKQCPFYGWEDETAESWCNVTAVRAPYEECPIKRFFD